MELEQKVVVILDFFESLVWFHGLCLTTKKQTFKFRVQFRYPVTYKRLNESFCSTFIYTGVPFPPGRFLFLSNKNREEQAQQCISYLFYCVKIHREKHPWRDREDCSVLNYLSSLGRAEEVLDSDSITKSVYSKYLLFLYKAALRDRLMFLWNFLNIQNKNFWTFNFVVICWNKSSIYLSIIWALCFITYY